MDDLALFAGFIMLVGVVTMLAMGIPISIAIGGASAAAMLAILPFERAFLTASQRMFTGVDSFSLLAIPFFVLAGNIMNNGGIAIRLVNCAKVFAGKLPGSLAQTNIVGNMMFGAVSGSGVAAAAAIGGTMTPLEEKEGYAKDYIAAVNIASAPTGMLIPPSNTMIVYSTVAGAVSISALFMAGYLPGILWGVLCMILAGFMAKKRGYVQKQSYSTAEVIKLVVDALPSFLLIIIVIGGILGGVFTATEGSAIAVVYSLGLSFIYRSLKISDLPPILLSSAKTTAIVVFMIGVSSIMSWVMSFTKIPSIIAGAIMGLTSDPILILLIMNIILLVVGTFMDPTPAVLIFTPIFLPICMEFGMHPVHFGVMIVMNLCVGTITPPVGPILFTGCKIANMRIEEVFRTLLPFFGVTILSLLLTTYIPALSMWIPTALGLVK